MRTSNKQQISTPESGEKTSNKQRGKASPVKNTHWESLLITKKCSAWGEKNTSTCLSINWLYLQQEDVLNINFEHAQAEWRLSNFTIRVPLHISFFHTIHISANHVYLIPQLYIVIINFCFKMFNGFHLLIVWYSL